MKCPKCKTSIPNNCKFCPECGADIKFALGLTKSSSPLTSRISKPVENRKAAAGSEFRAQNRELAKKKNRLGATTEFSLSGLADNSKTEGKVRESERNEKKVMAGPARTITLPGGAAMEIIYCPPGDFLMGNPFYNTSESAPHRVMLTKGFWLGKYPVTQRQWQSVMGSNPSEFKGEELPVECVSWNDCQKFIAKVNAAIGCGVRLPTKAEWEYACRAGTTGPYGGTGELDEMGWYDDNSASYEIVEREIRKWLGLVKETVYEKVKRQQTHPIGQKKPNNWGFCDMLGNVWEWCNDWYGGYPAVCETDPIGPASGGCRVLRGGSWSSHAGCCRSWEENRSIPDTRHNNYGFRLCFSAINRGS